MTFIIRTTSGGTIIICNIGDTSKYNYAHAESGAHVLLLRRIPVE
jgi:hypothetical protein